MQYMIPMKGASLYQLTGKKKILEIDKSGDADAYLLGRMN